MSKLNVYQIMVFIRLIKCQMFFFPFRHMFVKCVAFQTSGESNVFEPRFVSQEFDVVFMPLLPDDAIKVCCKSKHPI